MGKLFGAVTGFLTVIFLVLLLSLLFIKLGWYLFMVPVFGVSDITWVEAFGFSLLAASFKSTFNNNKKD